MIRKCTDEELEKVINPFYDNYNEYIITYVMPEVIAFYIASSYSRNAMWETTFYQHYNSAKNTFNVSDDEDYDSIKAEVIKLLRMKYSLEITSEDPFDLKKLSISLRSNTFLFSKKLMENLSLCKCRCCGCGKIYIFGIPPHRETSNNSYNSSFDIIPFSACS